VEWYLPVRAVEGTGRRQLVRPVTYRVRGPSVTVGGAVGAARGTAGGVGGAVRGAAVVAAWGRNPGGTVGAGRGATGGSKPGGISDAIRRGAGVEVPAVVSRVPMVETVRPDLQRKSRSVRLGEAASGKLSSSKSTCRETIKRFVKRSRQQ
jgi:hypothetical protein